MSARVLWCVGMLLMAVLRPAAAQQESADISWHDDPASAVEAAQKLGRPIVVFVTSDHCSYCRKMEREVWTDRRIRKLVHSQYVALRLNADASPEAVRQLRVRAFPTTLRFSPGGAYQDGFAGFVDGEKLSKYLAADPR